MYCISLYETKNFFIKISKSAYISGHNNYKQRDELFILLKNIFYLNFFLIKNLKICS